MKNIYLLAKIPFRFARWHVPSGLCFLLFFMAGCHTTFVDHSKATGETGAVEPITGMQKPAVIEMISDSVNSIDLQKLETIAKDNLLPSGSVYRWQNHLVIFNDIANPAKIAAQLAQAFPRNSFQVYEAPFYTFNRQKCDSGNVAKEWDHVLLSANLVADTLLQNEYLAYHATQYEKWPDISKGFCHADFQQLLIFRQGRQLMLVISIPRGASLDVLNPKTTQNNPKMNEWNELMKKYQEGIKGARPGEVWVFFKPVAEHPAL